MGALRLFQPAEPLPGSGRGQGELSPHMRLSEFVAEYYVPVHLLAKDARPRQYEEVDQSVKYWVRFTGDPPMNDTTPFHTRDFVVGLKDLPGKRQPKMANNTVRKHCGAIQAIFDLTGPQGPRRRHNLGLLDQPPYLQRPRKQKKPAEDCFTIEELELLLANADEAEKPLLKVGGQVCLPPTYMRRLYVFTFNTGLRIGGTMGACWAHDMGDHLALPGHGVVKGEDGLIVPINDVVREILDAMRGFDPERIFPWPVAWPASRQLLYLQHGRIVACLPPNRRFAFHGIRKLTNNELVDINPKACEKLLGHKTGSVNVESYTSRKIVAQAVAKLPKLKTSARQRQLFN